MRLDIRALSAGIGPMRILHEVTLEVAEGETVCLIGSNGAGKSTLMRSVAGLLRPVHGQVLLDGQPVQALPAERIVRHGLALVPEARQIFAPLTVRENLMMGAYARGGDLAGLDLVLDIFPKLAQRLEQAGGTLSGGEQQMLAIGRALMSAPRLLLLDEPSLGLAPRVVQEIFDVIAGLGRGGTSVLIAEQNASQALRIAQRGYVLREGRIVLSGQAQALSQDPGVRQAYLGV
ncbi:ABC transporter ATP-binding protein [Bordetella hinzii]|uniref:ABC transporter ATP-binding protein n=1 Tax=Bordetella hinzii TaxID=103855 RepID=UPI001C03868F|nr:ABC transporter ATP-binding protein [Bordetella hinzii]QWF52468.1 ABC transporter ATP-binding protein [Bordetella hinzii]